MDFGELEAELMAAAWSGELERMEDLVSWGARVNAKASSGHTALMRAAEEGHVRVVRWLVERGAELNAVSNRRRQTALVLAAVNGHREAVSSLAQAGADVNIPDIDNRTALMVAAVRGHVDVVRCLVAYRANLDAIDSSGWTALSMAIIEKHFSTARLLLDAGAAVNVPNARSALVYAAERDHMEAVQFLVDCGADVGATNWRGNTALHLATAAGHHGVVAILLPRVRPPEESPRSIAALRQVRPATSLGWSIPPFEIELLRFADDANVGGNYRAKWLGADVVVKLFASDASRSTMADEIHLWRQLRHPNVAKLYGACETSYLRFFVCEATTKGSLLSYLWSSCVDSTTPWKLLHQAALGLEYLHERKIVHGDLRCSNILIGNDDVAKLANFDLSRSTRARGVARQFVGSMRWQSPERLTGKKVSIAADVYSLGICIGEAVTQDIPWTALRDHDARTFKQNWAPENDPVSGYAPYALTGPALALVRRMCCRDPLRRPSVAVIAYDLERLAAANDPLPRARSQPDTEIDSAVGMLASNELTKLWSNVQSDMEQVGAESPLQYQFNELRLLTERLEEGTWHPAHLAHFHKMLDDFHCAVTAVSSPKQQWLSLFMSAHAPTTDADAFPRQLDVMWGIVGESRQAARERQTRRDLYRVRLTMRFVSEVTTSASMRKELESTDARSAFLTFMARELADYSSLFTPDQRAAIRQACDDISSFADEVSLPTTTLEWFVPRYELEFDETTPYLGKGGFGAVRRVKWLGSDVVIKEVSFAADSESRDSIPSLETVPSATQVTKVTDTAARLKQADALQMFENEVKIWHSLSHPHVVRLFGVCHVGTPFFVCEYATNGTLVDYVRDHRDTLWRLLHEAALGVLYLHERDIVHGDLKGNNIVIGRDGKAKVTDFGLSAIATSVDDTPARITGAWQWVAPECLGHDAARPTRESDVYALGMCVIEAMRVVGDEHPPYPWTHLENAVVKFHVGRGELPMRPTRCTDDQWRLVTHMCSHDPATRMKMMTVVDELAKLAARETTTDNLITSDQDTLTQSPSTADTIAAAKARVDLLQDGGLPSVVWTIAKTFLCCLEDTEVDSANPRASILRIYNSLWRRLEDVNAQAVGDGDFQRLVESASASTAKLARLGTMIGELTEQTLEGYALHRRLDKLMAAKFIVSTAQATSRIHTWKTRS